MGPSAVAQAAAGAAAATGGGEISSMTLKSVLTVTVQSLAAAQALRVLTAHLVALKTAMRAAAAVMAAAARLVLFTAPAAAALGERQARRLRKGV